MEIVHVTYGPVSESFGERTNAAVFAKLLPVLQTHERNARSVSRASVRHRHSAPIAQPVDVDRTVLEEMFVASRPQFLAIAYSILRNREDAEDAVQNAFASAFLHLRSFQGRSAVKTWFTRIVLNAALMIQRKRKYSRIQPLTDASNSQEDHWTADIPAAEANPEELHADREALQFVDGILSKMKPALRQAFTMTYFDELSSSEACALLGVSTGTFKARLFRARRHVLGCTKRCLVALHHRKRARYSGRLK